MFSPDIHCPAADSFTVTLARGANRVLSLLKGTPGCSLLSYPGHVTSLEVLDLDETVCIPIDNVFSMRCLNVSTEAIARQEEVVNWQHLRNFQLPKSIINEQVTLLIGVEVPKALVPYEVRRSQAGGGPFGIKTVFRWTLNGSLGRPSIDGKSCFYANSKGVDDDLIELMMINSASH